MFDFEARMRLFIIALTVLLTSVPCWAGRSTAHGQISVSQVIEMLEQAPTNQTARQLLTAYLAGVGEATGALIDTSQERNSAAGIVCKSRIGLDDTAVRQALQVAVPDHNRWDETAATPLIVRAMLQSAGCRVLL